MRSPRRGPSRVRRASLRCGPSVRSEPPSRHGLARRGPSRAAQTPSRSGPRGAAVGVVGLGGCGVGTGARVALQAACRCLG